MHAESVAAVVWFPLSPLSWAHGDVAHCLFPVVHGLFIHSVYVASAGKTQEVGAVVLEVLHYVGTEYRLAAIVSVAGKHRHHVELQCAFLCRDNAQHTVGYALLGGECHVVLLPGVSLP